MSSKDIITSAWVAVFFAGVGAADFLFRVTVAGSAARAVVMIGTVVWLFWWIFQGSRMIGLIAHWLDRRRS